MTPWCLDFPTQHDLHDMICKPLVCFLQGLVDAYVANSQQGKAVDYLNGLRDNLIAAAAAGSSGGSSSQNTAATAAAMPSSSDEAATSSSSSEDTAASAAAGDVAGGASSSDRVLVDPVGVQLLLGEPISFTLLPGFMGGSFGCVPVQFVVRCFWPDSLR
jgi:hypothetical protein